MASFSWKQIVPILAGVGAGFLFGGAGFSWGYFSIASTVAGFILNRPPKSDLSGAQIQKSAYGQPIPIVYGTFPTLAANIIDGPEDGALEEVPWELGSFKRSFTGAFMFCLGEAGDGCGERRIDELLFNDIVFFKRNGATNEEKFYLWREGNFWFDGPTFTYDAATGMEHFSGFQDAKGFWGTSNEFYFTRGTRKQTPIPFLAALHDGAVPAYRDCVLLAVNRLILKPWQESVPVVTAKIFNSTTGLYEICTAHLVRGGIDEDLLDLSVLQDTLVTEVDGCIQLDVEEPRSLVNALAAWGFADINEVDGMVKASDRANPDFFSISREELSAHGADDEEGAPPAIKSSIGGDKELPNILHVKFYDSDVDGQINDAPAPRQVGTGSRQQTISMPIVASFAAAQKFAQMALDEFYAAKTPIEVSLPFSRLKSATGDGLDIPDENDVPHSFRIADQVVGAPGIIACRCNSWNGEAYNQPHTPVAVARPPRTVPVYGAPDSVLIDTAALDAETVNSAGLTLIWAATAPASQSWSEVDLCFNSNDNAVATLTGKRAILGTIEDELEILTPFIFHDEATARVTLTDSRQELGSCTQLQARQGWNEALINGHLVRYTTATEVSPGVYDLSGLLFGLRGTETFLMPADSRFLLLRDHTGNVTPGWKKVVLTGANYAQAYADANSQWFLHYAPTELIADFTQTLEYNSRKAVSPSYIKARTDGASGAILGFLARSRGDAADLYWLTGETPSLTDAIKFDVVLYEPGTSTVAHTRRVTSTALVAGTESHVETTYSAAQLTTIFGSAPATLEGVIYPVNAAGRGFGRPFELEMP